MIHALRQSSNLILSIAVALHISMYDQSNAVL
jgi:hypothetical protein